MICPNKEVFKHEKFLSLKVILNQHRPMELKLIEEGWSAGIVDKSSKQKLLE